jgi:hypothetical protein
MLELADAKSTVRNRRFKMTPALTLIPVAALALLIVLCSSQAVSAQAADAKKSSGALLVSDMRKAVAYIGKNGKGISQRSTAARPFWSALKETSVSLDQLESGMKGKSPDMLKGLSGVGRGVSQVSASWEVLRGAHPDSKVSGGVRALSTSFSQYQNHFSPAAARAQRGGRITAGEMRVIKKSNARLTKLRSNLRRVSPQAKRNSHEQRMTIELVRLINLIAGLDTRNLNGYVTYLSLWDRLDYQLHSSTEIFSYWYPDYYDAWDVVAVDIDSYGDVFYESSCEYYDEWDYSSVEIEEYEEYSESISYIGTVTETEESEFEESIEAYSEDDADLEIDGESEQFESEVDIDDEDQGLLSDEEDPDDGAVDDEDADEDSIGDEEEDSDDGFADDLGEDSDDEVMVDEDDGSFDDEEEGSDDGSADDLGEDSDDEVMVEEDDGSFDDEDDESVDDSDDYDEE